MDYIFGDLHAMSNRDYSLTLFSNIVKFFKDFAMNTLKTTDNVFFLGDLYNKALNDGATVKIVYDIVSSIAEACNNVYILTGNHDLIQSYERIERKTNNALVSLGSIKNVQIISETPKEVVTDSASYFCMPYLSGLLSTEAAYNKYKYPDKQFDYALGHWTIDGTMKHISGVDASKIPAKQIICGHIHKRTDPRYLGSIWPCDRSQQDTEHTSVYAVISKDDCNFVPLPQFIRYFNVKSTDMPVRPKQNVIDIYYIETDNKHLDTSNFKDCYIARVTNTDLLSDLDSSQAASALNLVTFSDILDNLKTMSIIDEKVYEYCQQLVSA